MRAGDGMQDAELYVVAAAAVVLLLVLAYSAYGLLNPSAAANTAAYPNYQKFVSSQVPGNPCATPPGYTDAEWRQHMSHHPDQYAQCLT